MYNNAKKPKPRRYGVSVLATIRPRPLLAIIICHHQAAAPPSDRYLSRLQDNLWPRGRFTLLVSPDGYSPDGVISNVLMIIRFTTLE
jgi:hypothetical protein